MRGSEGDLRPRGEGDDRDKRREGEREEGQKKEGWREEGMEGLLPLLNVLFPLRRVLMMQSAVATVTGARKQQDHLARWASKEQPTVHVQVRVCENMCV